VNGERALDDFAPGTTTDDLACRPARTRSRVPGRRRGRQRQAVIGPVDLAGPRVRQRQAIAHLGADGAPTITPFVNDTAPPPTVRAPRGPPHRRRAGRRRPRRGQPVFSGLTNPNEDSADLPAGTVSASVAAAGTTSR
jgi:hypothetical protein